jgi:HK97 family phage major capsid protein
MDINDLLQKRGETVEAMNKMLDTAEKEGRDLTSDEQGQFDAMHEDQAKFKKQADNKLQVANLQRDVGVLNSAPYKAPVGSDVKSALETDDYKQAFNNVMRVGKSVADPSVLNALQVGTDSEGGYIVPTEFETQLVEALQDINELRNYVTVIPVGSDRNVPIESSLGTATWTAEEAAYTESDAAFGQVTLTPYKLGTIIKVSEELLSDAFFDVEGYLARNFGKRFGLAEETAFVNGSGSGQPTGITDGSSLGVTAAGAAAITADEMIDLYHSVARPYRANGTWIAADATVKLIRKLKDGDSQYMWQPGLQAGQPDMILGRPFLTSAGAEAATTGLKSVLFGDLSYYTVADRQGTVVQRLNELYAANGQVGFRGYKRMDGELTLSAAVKHLIQA